MIKTNNNQRKAKKHKKMENNGEDSQEIEDTEIELSFDDLGEVIKTEKMKEYEEITGKYSVWRGGVTEGFKKWLKGEKIYDRDKERISLYVSDDTKTEWQNFIKDHNYSTISKLIREAVNYFIDQKTSINRGSLYKMDLRAISNISHALKEPLTTIKGFSQLLIENHKASLEDEVLTTIENIFEQSVLLENKIISILDNISDRESVSIDVLLIEDDLATIRLLTSYFESKGHSCKGVISGTKGIEELKNSVPKLILLDVILPDLSGYDLCKMIKSDKNLKKIPVYLLTAIPGSEVEKKLDETKADGFILKPFDFSDFEILFEYM